MIQALIFDFDGCLMDTETTLLRSWQYEWRQHGLELDHAGFFADHGGAGALGLRLAVAGSSPAARMDAADLVLRSAADADLATVLRRAGPS